MTEEYKRQIAELCSERDQYKRERDELIDDLATVREQRKHYADENIKLVKMAALVMDERDGLKRKLDEVEDLFVGHIKYKLSVTHNHWYINLRHKLHKIIHGEKENG